MKIFFKKTGKKTNSKPFLILKMLLIVLMVAMLAMAILNDIDIFYVKLVFILLGINFVVEGVESYFLKENQLIVGKEIGFGILFFLIAIFLH